MVTAMFNFAGAHPASLEASVVAASEWVRSGAETIPVATWRLDCAREKNPGNDACRAASIYPAELTHTRGSIFGGSVTGTRWRCELGGCAGCRDAIDVSAACAYTHGGTTATTTLDLCEVLARSVVAVNTAGEEKLGSMELFNTNRPEVINSALAALLSSARCLPTPVVMSVPAKATRPSTPASSSDSVRDAPSTGSTQANTGASVTSAQAPSTSQSTVAPTGSGRSAAGRHGRQSGWWLSVVAVGLVLSSII